MRTFRLLGLMLCGALLGPSGFGHPMRRVLVLGLLALGAVGPVPARGQTVSVLAVVPEGAVIDASQLPDLKTGTRFTFRRPQGDAGEVGQGSVLDVREGRGLIGLPPGNKVQAGDLALPCASTASQADLRATVQQIKAQVPGTGASPEIQRLLAELDATVDARDAAIRAGACDVSVHDQKVTDLGVQLQQALATAPPPAPPPAASGPPGPQLGALAGAPSAGASGGSSDNLSKLVEVVGRLFQMAQSLGLGPGGGGAAVPSPPGFASPAAPAPPPQFTDPGAGVAPPSPPPVAGGAPGMAPLPPPPPVPPVTGDQPGSALPPSAGPPSTGGPTGVVPPPAPGPTNPPVVVARPLPGLRPVPGTGAQPPATNPPTPSNPPVASDPSGPRPPWWTVIKPHPLPPTADSGATHGSKPEAPRLAPGIIGLPGLAGPGGLRAGGHVAAAKPGLIRGRVHSDAAGHLPVAGAFVLVGDRRVTTNAQGMFAVAGLPAGKYHVVVTATGFHPANAAVTLSPGEIENVSLTLRRQAGPSHPVHPLLPGRLQAP